MKTMKKNLFFSLGIVTLLFMASACESSDYNKKLTLKLSKDISVIPTETKTKTTTTNLYAVQIYDKTAEGEYSPKFQVVFEESNLDDIEIDTERGKTYKICCSCITASKDYIDVDDSGCYEAPLTADFLKTNVNMAIQESTIAFDKLQDGGIMHNEVMEYYSNANRYYNEISDVAADAGDIALEVKCNFFKLNYFAQGMIDNSYMTIRLQNQMEDEGALVSLEKQITKANLITEDGVSYKYNLLDQSIATETMADVYLKVKYMDENDKLILESTQKLEVSKKKAYDITFDVKMGLNINLEDAIFTDGGATIIDL